MLTFCLASRFNNSVANVCMSIICDLRDGPNFVLMRVYLCLVKLYSGSAATQEFSITSNLSWTNDSLLGTAVAFSNSPCFRVRLFIYCVSQLVTSTELLIRN